MHLLDVETLQLSEFFDSSIPPYVILSHTWGEDETSFQAIRSDHSTLKGKAGFGKIKGACKIARSDGFKYIWIDTCCIDKTSSAELSEAINSMYRWYQDADVCYVFLSDVHSTSDPAGHDSQFRSSRWFARGWTLQELLAPRSLIFYTSSWEELGTKRDLRGLVREITKIPSEVVDGQLPMSRYSIAQKMSWAASRSTTREEDRAYSMMGIFKVNMPMLYGEGRSAFRRLQEEIMKRDDDQSLFAWKLSQDQQRGFGWAFLTTGLLAPDPCAFAESGSVNSVSYRDGKGFTTTNVAGGGIMLSLRIVPSPYEEETDNRYSYVALDCYDPSYGPRSTGSRLCILVMHFPINSISCRVNAEILRSVEVPRSAQRQTLHFQALPTEVVDFVDGRDQRIWIDNLERKGFRIERTIPKLSLRDGKFRILQASQYGEHRGALRFLGEGGKSFVLFICIQEGIVMAKPYLDVLWEDEFDNQEFGRKYDVLNEEMPERSRWYSEDNTWGVDLAIRRRFVDGERCVYVCLDIIDGPRTKRQ